MPDQCTKFTVYVLRLANGKYYVGSTAKPIDVRIAEHREKRGKLDFIGAVGWCTKREIAEKIERKIAARLRVEGKDVIQG